MSIPAILFVLLSNPAQTPPPGPPKLEIESHPAEDTGTMHYAVKTLIRLPGASPLELSAEDEDTQQPILEKQFALTDRLFLVLGFSSEGAGMQTIHALLIENETNRLVIKDELRFHSARDVSRLLVRRRGPITRLGIFGPATVDIEFSEGYSWSVFCGPGNSIEIDRESKLRAEQYESENPRGNPVEIHSVQELRLERLVRLAPDDFCYWCYAGKPLPKTGVFWFDAGPAGFRLVSKRLHPASKGRR